MLTIKLDFPSGHYHATPFGHHVNEGMIEWPPAPWRILRALVAQGFSNHGWDQIPSTAQSLFDKMAEELPSYRLPCASTGHSRHFMPIIEGASERRPTPVLDTWANVGNSTVWIQWPCQLDNDELRLLGELVGTMNYLGRSESWVEAQLAAPYPDEWNAEPCRDNELRGPEWEQVALLAAVPSRVYSEWRAAQLKQSEKSFEGLKPTAAIAKKRAKAMEPYPPDLLACLVKDTVWWKGQGWSQPIGARRVLYWRRRSALTVATPRLAKPALSRPVTTMLLSLATASGNRSALPTVNRTLPQAEIFHRAIVGWLGRGERTHCPELTGKDDEGQPLHDHHDHAHTIPVDLDNDGHIDHVIVYAKSGLNDAAQYAIRSLRRTWTKGGAGDIQVTFVGSGDLALLRKLPPPFSTSIRSLLGKRKGSRIWESVTPFVPPRYPKPRGKNTIAGQINAELASRLRPEAQSVTVLDELTKELRHFVRMRNSRVAVAPVDMGLGLRIVFHEPIEGPLLLGYASHYGLGRFRAVDDRLE